MRKHVCVFFLLICFSLPTLCHAANPSDFVFNGTTGLTVIPVAEVLPAMSYRVGVRALFLPQNQNDVGYGFGNEDVFASIGLGRGVELGVEMLNSDLEAAFNIQYLAVKEVKPWPSIAFGTQNLSELGKPEGQTTQSRADRSIYAVATWHVPDYMLDPKKTLLRFHLGGGSGRFKNVFGGMDFRILDEWLLFAEYDGYGASFGISFAPESPPRKLFFGSSYVSVGETEANREMYPAVVISYEDNIINGESLSMAEPAPEKKPSTEEATTVATPEAPAEKVEEETKAATEEMEVRATEEVEVKEATPEAKPAPAKPPKKSKIKAEWYRVRVGIYSKKSSAVTLKIKLAADGYDSFLVNQAGLWRLQVGAFKDPKRADALAKKLRLKGYTVDVVVAE
jgi:cell division septation protein DedD